MIFGFVNQKGGVGKTTLALNVAASFARRGARVLVVDADPQASAMDWSEARTEALPVPVVGLPRSTIHREIVELARDYEHVFIDAPPRVTDLSRAIIVACDIVVIPVQPSPLDVWAAGEVVALLTEARVFKPSSRATFVINRKIANSAIGRDVRDALANFDVPTCATAIAQRVVFAEAAASGRAAFEADPAGPAATEIEALSDELSRTFT